MNKADNIKIHQDTLREFYPNTNIAKIVTLFGTHTLVGINAYKMVDAKLRHFENETVPMVEDIIMKKEKEISEELLKLKVPRYREFSPGCYYLVHPLNNLLNDLHSLNMVIHLFKEKTSFFRFGKWWTGHLIVRSISQALHIDQKSVSKLIKEMRQKGIIERKKFSAQSQRFALLDEKYAIRCKENFSESMMTEFLKKDGIMDRIDEIINAYK